MIPAFLPGQVRDDGYIFVKYHKHPNGKTYPMFSSPLAFIRQRERVRNWRLNNLEHARQLVRNWRKRRKEAKDAKKRALNAPEGTEGAKGKKTDQESPRNATAGLSRKYPRTKKASLSKKISSSSISESSSKMEPSGHGTGAGLVPLVPFPKGNPLKGVSPIGKLEPLGTTTAPFSVPFLELEPKQTNKKKTKKKILSKGIEKVIKSKKSKSK